MLALSVGKGWTRVSRPGGLDPLAAQGPAAPARLDAVLPVPRQRRHDVEPVAQLEQLVADRRHDLAGRRDVGCVVGTQDEDVHGDEVLSEDLAPIPAACRHAANSAAPVRGRAEVGRPGPGGGLHPRAARVARPRPPRPASRPRPTAPRDRGDARLPRRPRAARRASAATTGRPGSQCFEHGDAEALVAGREGQRPGAVEEHVELVARDAPEPVHQPAPLGAELAELLLQGRLGRRLAAGEDEVEVARPGAVGDGPGEDGVVLVGVGDRRVDDVADPDPRSLARARPAPQAAQWPWCPSWPSGSASTRQGGTRRTRWAGAPSRSTTPRRTNSLVVTTRSARRAARGSMAPEPAPLQRAEGVRQLERLQVVDRHDGGRRRPQRQHPAAVVHHVEAPTVGLRGQPGRLRRDPGGLRPAPQRHRAQGEALLQRGVGAPQGVEAEHGHLDGGLGRDRQQRAHQVLLATADHTGDQPGQVDAHPQGASVGVVIGHGASSP